MKGRTLLILIILAAVLVGWSFVKSKKDSKATAHTMGQQLLSELPVNDIEKIVVTSGSGSAVVARANDTWTCPEKFGYAADFQKIREALLKLTTLKSGPVMRLSEQQKKELQIVPPGKVAAAGTGTLVELFAAGGRKVCSIIVGKTHEKKSTQETMPGAGSYPDGQYISLDDGKTVYLVTDTFEQFSAQPKDWLDAELLNVTPSDIAGIKLVSQDKRELKLSRTKDMKMDMEGLAKDEEADPNKLYSLESALSYLRFDDIADPQKTDAETGMDKPAVYQATTSRGQIFTVKIGNVETNGSSRYAHIEVALQPVDTNKPAPDATDTNAVAAATQAAADRKQLEEDTASLSARLGAWTCLLDSYKTSAMTSTRKDIVKKKEDPKVEDKDQPEVAGKDKAKKKRWWQRSASKEEGKP